MSIRYTVARRLILTLAVLAMAAGFILVAPAHPADAATTVIEFDGSDFYIPRPAGSTDQEGVERLLASYDLAANGHAELIGDACSVAGTSANGESVHPNNYGMLRSNGDSVRISGTEDEANGVRLSDRSIVLGPTINLYNVMVPDSDGTVATSVGYVVVVTCITVDETTTTTQATTTTTQPTTTTTEATTTTTGVDTSTTSGASTSTTGADTTTTSSPDTSSTTGGGTETSTTTVPPVTGSTLPFTGPVEAAGVAMAAGALILLGAGLVLGLREGEA